ncbi:RNA polymerase sigma factor [Clavibacter phaseoli]|uniref:RNA polymerase sigma factor n=1 Tax=Clavibacter phaseoli TaxID=1734031 RepID=UPI001F1969C3|nr:sigma-70 family RNA polymerase sigma factor [Clavibacter phaseoli]UKF32437.1 sigma-70 family RNA polymerase sigma factor [Clavibacter phaseoli]UKF38446.1 sigma-70 family RNA polymerase sigma factor [Clavibacter phaseoli]
MRRARARITAALSRSSGDLLTYLQRRVGLDEAPDLLGETMVVAWRRIDDLPEDPDQARMWLFGIARTTLLNHVRGERRRWALADRIRGNAATEPTSPAADYGAEVRDAVARLDTDLVELVQLVHWEGMTVAQAAALLGVSESTARIRYTRAKDQLRATLEVLTSSGAT